MTVLALLLIVGACVQPVPDLPPNTPTAEFTHVYEAESASLATSIMGIASAPDIYSNGSSLMQLSSSDDSPDATPPTDATIAIDIPETGSYTLWVRLRGGDSSSDSAYIGFDTPDQLVTTDGYYGEFTWAKVGPTQLSAGAHTIAIAHRDAKTELDAFVVTNKDTTGAALEPLLDLPAAPVCGDGTCDAGETKFGCPADCSANTGSTDNLTTMSWSVIPYDTTRDPNKPVLLDGVTMRPNGYIYVSSGQLISKINWYLDGEQLAVRNAPPQTVLDLPADIADGEHTVRAVLANHDGTLAADLKATFSINSTAPTFADEYEPTAMVQTADTQPTQLDGQSFGTAMTFTIDGVQHVAHVTWSVDGILKDTDHSAPFEYPTDGSGISPESIGFGTHTISARIAYWDGSEDVVQGSMTALDTSGLATHEIQVSTNPDRSEAKALDGMVLSGNNYIFVAPDADIDHVDFYVDSLVSVAPYSTESVAPYDLAGTADDGSAQPYDVSGLGPMDHRVDAIVTRTDGSVERLQATFTTQSSCPTGQVKDSSGTCVVSGTALGSIGAVVHGTGNAPLAGATVTLDPGSDAPGVSCTTSSDGSCTIPEVSVGTHTIRVSRDGYVSQDADITVSEGSTASRIVTLIQPTQTGSLRIYKIADTNGNALSGVNASILNAIGSATNSCITDTTGSCTIKNIEPNTYDVKLVKNGYAPANSRVTIQAGKEASISRSLTEQIGSVSVTVKKSDGLALPGAKVVIGADTTDQRQCTTSLAGACTITNVPIGSHTVTASASSYESKSTQISVGDAGKRVSLTMTLSPSTGTVAVTATTPTGTGAGHVVATLLTSDYTSTGKSCTTSSKTGTCTISGVAAGDYQLRYKGDGYVTFTGPIRVAAGQTTKASHQFISTTGSVRITATSDGVAIGPMTAKLLINGDTTGMTCTSGLGGICTIHEVTPADYTVKTSAEGYKTATDSVSVQAGSTADVRAGLLPATGTLKASASKSSGASLSDVTVDLYQNSKKTGQSCGTGLNGVCTIDSVAEGSYLVRFTRPGFDTATKETIITGGSTTTARVEMQPSAPTTGAVQVSVSSASGPLAGVKAQLLLGTTNSEGKTTWSTTGKSCTTQLTATGNRATCTLDTIAPGLYLITMSKTDYIAASTRITIVAGKTAGISTTLSPAHTGTYCGDGIVQKVNDEGVKEKCDDGNTNNADACSNSCQYNTADFYVHGYMTQGLFTVRHDDSASGTLREGTSTNVNLLYKIWTGATACTYTIKVVNAVDHSGEKCEAISEAGACGYHLDTCTIGGRAAEIIEHPSG